MTIMAVTRLRLKDPALSDEFLGAAGAVLEQAKASDGCVGADALAEANNVWWTATAWHDRRAMKVFVNTEPHLTTLTRIDDWCDEATFVDWEQSSPELPDWKTSYRRIVADGQRSSLTDASEAHATRAFPPPVEPG
jgi:hypothetical protein